jgi:predicted branched-subunit amino acid permease
MANISLKEEQSQLSPRQFFFRGLICSLPLAVSVMAYGTVFGVLAFQSGLTPWQVLGMSALVFAGSSQFAVLPLLGGTLGPILLTTYVINLRHYLMAGSLLPYWSRLAPHWRGLLAFFLNDETYALTISQYRQGRGHPLFYAGSAALIYVAWVSSTVAGAFLGRGMAGGMEQWGLDFVFPAAFIGILVPQIRNRVELIVVLLAGAVSLALTFFVAGNWNIVVAGVAASYLGLFLIRGGE